MTANRRMFSIEVVNSDDFIEMSHDAQLLYFHLSMSADDEGILKGKARIMRTINIDEKYYKELQEKGFIYDVDGITIIRHWKISNMIRKDRFKPSIYTSTTNRLESDENGVYVLNDNQMTTKQQPSIEKISKEKISKEKIRKGQEKIEKFEKEEEQIPIEQIPF